MPYLTVPPPPPAAIRPFWEAERYPLSFSPEARELADSVERISRHWREQSGDTFHRPAPDGNPPSDSVVEPESYCHVPLKIVGRIQIRVRQVTDLPPRQLDFDQDHE
jgi:hypothetical protein